jgi:hypothetical protein
VVHEQSLQTGRSRSAEIRLALVAHMQHLAQLDVEPLSRYPEDASRGFSDTDFARNNHLLKCVANVQVSKDVKKPAIEV